MPGFKWGFGKSGFGLGFALPENDELRARREAITEGMDWLITHSPPFGVLDVFHGKHMGCKLLHKEVIKAKPKVHMFGHVHSGYGCEWDKEHNIQFINAANLMDNWNPVVFDYCLETGQSNIVKN